MKTCRLLLALVCLGAPVFLPAQSRKEKTLPSVAKTWTADAKTYDGKTVETYVASMGNAGRFSMEAPYAVVPIATATADSAAGGEILLLLPPREVAGIMTGLKPQVSGGSSFGNKVKLQKLSATFRLVNGEAVLVKGGDAGQLGKIGKPSELLAKQLAVAGERLPQTKYPSKVFEAAEVGNSGRAETKVLFAQLREALNAQQKKEDPKTRPYSESTLRRALRDGAVFQIDDDASKTTWTLVWKK